jgi:hypothetical protein
MQITLKGRLKIHRVYDLESDSFYYHDILRQLDRFYVYIDFNRFLSKRFSQKWTES